MAEEPSSLTYATPPNCEQKKEEEEKEERERERERVERTSKGAERSQKITSERPQYPNRRSTGKSSNTNMSEASHINIFLFGRRGVKKKQETHICITTGQRQSFHL